MSSLRIASAALFMLVHGGKHSVASESAWSIIRKAALRKKYRRLADREKLYLMCRKFCLFVIRLAEAEVGECLFICSNRAKLPSLTLSGSRDWTCTNLCHSAPDRRCPERRLVRSQAITARVIRGGVRSIEAPNFQLSNNEEETWQFVYLSGTFHIMSLRRN